MKNNFVRSILRGAQVMLNDLNVLYGMFSDHQNEIAEIRSRMLYVIGLIQGLLIKMENTNAAD